MPFCTLKRKNQFRRVIRDGPVIVLFAGTVFASTASIADGKATECPDGYRLLYQSIRPNLGAPARLKGFENENTRLIGSGMMGGHVYVVQPKDAASYIVKVYDLGGATIARNDRLAFSVLDQALNKTAARGSLKSVRVLEEIDSRTLKLEHIPGRDVDDVGWNAGNQTARLRRMLLRQLQEAKHKIEKIGRFEIEGSTFEVAESSLRKRGEAELWMTLKNVDANAKPAKIQLILKSDGIALTADGQFVVFDPS